VAQVGQEEGECLGGRSSRTMRVEESKAVRILDKQLYLGIPNTEVTDPASTNVGYSSGDAATAYSSLISACNSSSDSMNFSGSSLFFILIFRFFVIFFSKLSSSCFKLLESSCSIFASASSSILSMSPFLSSSSSCAVDFSSSTVASSPNHEKRSSPAGQNLRNQRTS
jgi:hypothetical protein